ncbi:MAG TPA: amidohydrolase family protein [Sphingobacteriaceae bacterium]|nr:amidohydrolase family protein [Sphingobacteriaceae bacterium]
MIKLSRPIIDFHAHFPAGRWRNPAEMHPALAEYGRERGERMRKEWDFPEPEPPAETEEEIAANAHRWRDELDRYGIQRIVFVTGKGNDVLASVVRRHPDRFFGLAHHDPCGENALEELQRAVEELGLVGYKMFGPGFDRPFEDESLKPLWTYLADRKLPVLIHFGLLGHAGGIVHHPRISPLTLFNVAREYADIPFVIPHFGCGYMQELLHLCWSCPNIYVDTSGSNQWMRWMPYEITLESAFRKFYETIGPRRIIFGSDSSWFPRGFSYRYLQDQVRVCYQMNMPEEDIGAIFGGNAARLLGLDVEG